MQVFNISKQSMLDYIHKGVKIEYKSDLLKEEWYKGLTTCINRWLKLSKRVKVPTKVLDISMNKYIGEIYVEAMTLQVASIQKRYIKEHVHRINDNPMVEACALVALLYMIDMLLNHDKLELIQPKDLKYMRWLCSTYRNTLGAILYDIDSYKGYIVIHSTKFKCK